MSNEINLIHREAIVELNGTIRQAGADPGEGDFAPQLRAEAERDLFFFCTAILGYQFLSPGLHKDVCLLLQKCPPFRKLLLLPRLHAKTLIVSHSLPLHVFIQPQDNNVYTQNLDGSDHRILLCCESERLVKDRIRVLQSHCENNLLLRGLWPHRMWETPSRQAPVWNATEMVLPRATEYPDPSIRGIGVGGAITGARPSVMINDDIISFEAANSDVVMQGAIDWFKASRALLEKYAESSGIEALQFIVGTRWATWDLYSDLIANDPTLAITVRSIVESGKMLWPERWSLDDIPRLIKEQGEAMFSLLYMNNPYDASLVAFDMNLVRLYLDKHDELCINENELDDALREKFAPAQHVEEKLGKLKGIRTKADKSFWDMLEPAGRVEFMTHKYPEGFRKDRRNAPT